MGKIQLPYLASCDVAGMRLDNLEVVEMNKGTVWVRLPTGRIIKRHVKKHRVRLAFLHAGDSGIQV